MSNIIKMHAGHSNIDEWLSMSNGGTSVFITVLVLSGSRMAEGQREKELIVWLAEHDQDVVGIGTVGFDISDMPWTRENFADEKAFIIRVIEGAETKLGWKTLNYEPSEERILSYLSSFKRLVEGFEEIDIDERSYDEWIELCDDPVCGIPKGFPKCQVHNVYLHFGGCVACNDK